MTFDDAARARIATGWLNSSLDQATYAAQHGISTRTLRDWVCRFGGGRRPQAQLRAAIVASIEQLQNVLAALDAESDAASAAPTEGVPPLVEHQVERHAGPARPPASAAALSPEAEPLAPRTPEAGGPAGAQRPSAVRDGNAAGDEPKVAGPEHVMAVADGAGPTAGRRRPVAPLPSGEVERSAVENDMPRAVDLDALRRRAAQLRVTRTATGRTRQPFDWDAE